MGAMTTSTLSTKLNFDGVGGFRRAGVDFVDRQEDEYPIVEGYKLSLPCG